MVIGKEDWVFGKFKRYGKDLSVFLLKKIKNDSFIYVLSSERKVVFLIK